MKKKSKNYTDNSIIIPSKLNFEIDFDVNKELRELSENYCNGCNMLKTKCICTKGIKETKNDR